MGCFKPQHSDPKAQSLPACWVPNRAPHFSSNSLQLARRGIWTSGPRKIDPTELMGVQTRQHVCSAWDHGGVVMGCTELPKNRANMVVKHLFLLSLLPNPLPKSQVQWILLFCGLPVWVYPLIHPFCWSVSQQVFLELLPHATLCQLLGI